MSQKKISQDWIIKKYREFVNKPMPEVVEKYNLQEDLVLIDVFLLEPPKKDSALILPESMTLVEKGIFWLPIAKVLKSSVVGIQSGDIVRLSDYKVAVFKNTKYDEWQSLSTKGNVEKLGQTPPPYVTKFYETFMRFTFSLSPLLENKGIYNTFLVHKMEIMSIITDPDALVY